MREGKHGQVVLLCCKAVLIVYVKAQIGICIFVVAEHC